MQQFVPRGQDVWKRHLLKATYCKDEDVMLANTVCSIGILSQFNLINIFVALAGKFGEGFHYGVALNLKCKLGQ